jgi:glycosyltransferase involved in cell wall biosynthesis
MRILLTTDTVGGVWTYALELAHALGGHGVRVALATMGAALSPDQRRDAQRLPHVQVFESTFKLEWMQDPWRDVQKAGDWLLNIEREFRPDVVHLNGYTHGSLPWRARVVIVAHSCVLSWWRAVKGCEAPASWDRYREEVTRGLRAAAVVVAPSHAMLDAVLYHYGAPADARVIHNGRHPAPYLAATPKEEIILTAGRIWDEAKNIHALACIAPKLPWPVCVAGEEKHPDGGAARPCNVHALGKLSADQLAPWFRRASIYALPARYEPFGLTALEAGMAGCALVLGDIPSLREIWDDAALFVRPDDSDQLSLTLRGLIADVDRRKAMALRARRRALGYSVHDMADAYLSQYRELCDRPAPIIAPDLPGVVASASAS